MDITWRCLFVCKTWAESYPVILNSKLIICINYNFTRIVCLSLNNYAFLECAKLVTFVLHNFETVRS